MTGRLLIVVAALAAVIAVPFVLKPKASLLAAADDTLTIISPHQESIRYEFSRAFGEYYKKKTGRTVRIDWRIIGGTSEITRYLTGEYFNAFRRTWESGGKRKWNAEVAGAFANGSIKLPDDPSKDTPAEAARRAFLTSNAGIGIDLFFGGGSFDFIGQAKAGNLVDCGVVKAHPEWFTDASIPINVSGEPYYDAEGRWIGNCLSSFGICYNTDSLRRLGVTSIPASWNDLTDPKFFKQVALADPTKSGSSAKTFEMVIQQQMAEAVGPSGTATDAALADGWQRGLQLLLKASANSRYFADGANKVPVDVALGDAAIGMSIDFYGRFQSETIRVGDQPSRLQYFTPLGGSSVGVDPIGMLRGAPHPEIAKEFIAFVLSIDGQKLWNFKVGTPGGPTRYALRRPPIRKELYEPQYAAFRSDPTVFPYEEAKTFTYHDAWTGPLFSALRFVIRVSCIDSHEEQSSAWKALITANFPPQATATFLDISRIDFDSAKNEIKPALKGSTPLDEVRLARELGDHFREQYRRAEKLAKEGK